MAIVTLFSRALRAIPFWTNTAHRLVRHHDYVVRDIDTTPSTPGDLTFSQLPISLILTSAEFLADEQLLIINSLLTRARRVAVVVEQVGRSWEHIQSQLVTSDLPVSILVVSSPLHAANSIASFVEASSTSPDYGQIDTRQSAEQLRHIPLGDEALRWIFDRTVSLADIVNVVLSPDDDRNLCIEEAGQQIVSIIRDYFLANQPSWT